MKYFEDAEVGDVFLSPEAYHVTADEIKSFAAEWDPQRYHLDEKEAEKLIGRLFSSAFLTLCIGQKLAHASGYFEILPAAGLGIEELSFPKPVFADDSLSARVTVTAKRESKSKPDLGLLTHKTEVLNQHGKVVLSYVITSLVYRRPDAT